MKKRDSRAVAERVLRRLGFVQSDLGTNYLAEAILLCCEDTLALCAVTKRVYPAVARRFRTRWKNVERDMRTAANHFWARGNRPFFFEMVGFELQVRPTVGEIISYIVGYIREFNLLDDPEDGPGDGLDP